ncbi:FG-GAP repeat domain-containing protein [Chryseolinea soli]|uniref:VCBS repeat-containing protein n=1 Tax=Chryseolinea soli TaxID=2321403 RepID=A0A385SMB0_9BACT|nr:VCBS repeat-containing protein [Chryseolinea soli]AYB31972.1 VCBS repeat-containing protein [Chryseolinea soli]
MIKVNLLVATFLSLTEFLFGQGATDRIRSKNFPKFPQVSNVDIAGAPILSQPALIVGKEKEIRTEKHGLAYPAFYDWNRDGKMDLLLGEFETGQTGSYIKVYLNTGSNNAPAYSGKYFYARDVKGDTLTAYQWCCIGVHPRVVDLNGDGYPDILTGQYNPGQVSWWRGSKEGFLPRQFVEQEGYVEKFASGSGDQLDPKSNDYWNYTSTDFADFNEDGLLDLFVGGFGELRVALNVGTKESPKFGLRKYLLGIDGLPLSVVNPSDEQLLKAHRAFTSPHYAGVYKSFINPVDWDGDGVLDLLVTHVYDSKKTPDPVVFFRGVQTDKGLRFESSKSLFTAMGMYKTFPGCQPNIRITDYNHDGVQDLVIGLSLPTVNGFEIDSLASWSYLKDLGIEAPGKDAGRAIEYSGGIEAFKKKIESDADLKSYYLGKLRDSKYLTIRHRGYAYVMLGKKNPVAAKPRVAVIAQEDAKPVINEIAKRIGEGPVQVNVKAPGAVRSYQTDSIVVSFAVQEGWYLYADTKGNEAQGWIPTKMELTFPKGMEAIDPPVLPKSHYKGGSEIYNGNDIKFIQKFRLNDDARATAPELMVNVTIHYQTCNGERCLVPVTEQVEMKMNYVR